MEGRNFRDAFFVQQANPAVSAIRIGAGQIEDLLGLEESDALSDINKTRPSSRAGPSPGANGQVDQPCLRVIQYRFDQDQ